MQVQALMELELQEEIRPAIGAGGMPSIIQWETASFYTYETEVDGEPLPDEIPDEEYPAYTDLSLGMSRLGSASGAASVSFRSFDMSAEAGKNYEEVPPTTVNFADGETHKEITVRVIPNKTFAGTVEFGLFIDKGTAKGATVGKYLHTATVKIIDQSFFPDNSLGDYVKGGDRHRITEIHPALLVWNFLRMCWTVPVVRQGSIKVMLTHQYHNAIMIMNIFILYFAVKTLSVSEKNKAQRKGYMWIYGLLWLVPFLGKHYLDYSKCFWKVGGGLRKHLQMLLLKKFLNYNESARAQVAVEKVVMAMVRDVVDAVSEAYIVSIDLVFGSFVKLLLLILAMMTMQAGVVNWATIEPINVVPPIVAILLLLILCLIFVKIRAEKGFDLRQKQFDAENGIVEFTIRTVLNYELVADYDRRTFQTASYEKFVIAFNKASVAYAAFTVNSKYFAAWLTNFLVAIWIIYGGIQVVEAKPKGINLATFLSTITIFRSAGAEFEKAYQLYLRMAGAYASIAQITTYLNLPVDVPMRRIFGRKRRKFGLELRTAERAKMQQGKVAMDPDDVAVDRLPIKLENANFAYDGQVAAGLKNMNLEFSQGKLVAMKGPPAEGKATVLRLLAQSIFPTNVDDALVFTPPHLRCVQVQENPKILGGEGATIFSNITYGIKQSPSTDWAALEKRSRAILEALGASKETMAIFNDKDEDKLGTDGLKLTRQDRQLVNLGRAFLMNPEMIIIHKPTAILDKVRQDKVVAMMQEYVRNRGVMMDPNEPLVMRRKRTLIFTTLNDAIAAQADEVYQVEGGRLEKVTYL